MVGVEKRGNRRRLIENRLKLNPRKTHPLGQVHDLAPLERVLGDDGPPSADLDLGEKGRFEKEKG